MLTMGPAFAGTTLRLDFARVFTCKPASTAGFRSAFRQKAGKLDEICDANPLCPRGRIDVCCLKQGRGVYPQRIQARPQHLAPLAESCGGDFFQQSHWNGLGGGGSGHDLDQGGLHLRRRHEYAWR